MLDITLHSWAVPLTGTVSHDADVANPVKGPDAGLQRAAMSLLTASMSASGAMVGRPCAQLKHC